MNSTLTQPHILIVTGYSGAGKSTVLRALEDIGFFCIDNLPLALFDSLYQFAARSKMHGQRIALGVDMRGGYESDLLLAELAKCKDIAGSHVKIFFLTSSSRVLLRRFQETRRKHPLANNVDIADAIEREKRALRPLIEIADIVLDTDHLNIHQLRNFVRSAFAGDAEQKLLVNLVSFGFKYGVPDESNYVYDVRSLPNPYFSPELKPLKGTDQQVIDYLFGQAEVNCYWDKLIDFVSYSLDKSQEEGRSFMKIAIGCTGGRHRSVAFVDKLAKQLAAKAHVIVEHRDIENDPVG